jgi:hypothetical protein
LHQPLGCAFHKFPAGDIRLCNNFRPRARRRGPQVGDKIRDRKINFVPHRRNNRQFRRGNGSRDSLFVKTPKILDRTAAAGNQDKI